MEASTQAVDAPSEAAPRTERPRAAKPARKPRSKKPTAAEPAKSVESAKSVEPAGPAEPAKSAEPAKRAEPETATETAPEPEPENKAAAEPEAEAKTAAEPKSEAKAAAEPESEPESESEPEAETPVVTEETRERAIEAVRAHETPIFAAMFAGWDGPAVGLISRNLHRADDDTMVFEGLMWQPSPERTPPALRFQVAGDRHAPVVTATGELTAGSAALLTTPLRHILRRRPRQMIVDLAGITAATPGGLRALLEVRQNARAAHVDFWLRSPSEPVRELLQTNGKQVAVRSKQQPATRRSPAPNTRRGDGANAAPAASAVSSANDAMGANAADDGDATTPRTKSAARAATRPKAQLSGGKLHGSRRRTEPDAEQVLEGVVVDGPATRSRSWWSSHSLRESLRRVGAHQHPHGHGSPT